MSTQDDYEESKLDEVIDRILETMSGVEPDTKEYASMADQLAKIYKMKEIESNIRQKQDETRMRQLESQANCRLREVETALKKSDLERANRVSLDTWATIGGHILGVVIIVGYERANVITSKALSFVMRLR